MRKISGATLNGDDIQFFGAGERAATEEEKAAMVRWVDAVIVGLTSKSRMHSK